MNWILALVAFAGLMAILSTVVTVSVEALHKAFSMRKTGLQEMLRALHDNVIRELEAGRRPGREVLRNNGRSKEAAHFANAMTKSPSFGGGGRWWWPSNWRINLFQRRFERLTKRQFAEQLAQTEFGRKLAERDRGTIRRILAHTSYEFDRYGVAQSQFFRRRAKVLSGLVAFSFVALANVNAIDIYMHLATNEAALGRTMQLLDDTDLASMARQANAAEESLQSQLQTIEREVEALREAGGEAAVVEAQLAAIREARENVAFTVRQLGADTGLPMGRAYFPYCEAPELDPDQCDDPDQAIPIFQTNYALTPAMSRLLTSPGETVVWVLSLVATAGLLGLGAPFWFDLFNKTAGLVGGRIIRQPKLDASPSGRAAAVVRNPGKRGDEEPEIEEMTDAFLIASGEVDTPYPVSLPIGGRLGDASREEMARPLHETVSSTGAEGRPPAGIRRVPGTGTGGAEG